MLLHWKYKNTIDKYKHFESKITFRNCIHVCPDEKHTPCLIFSYLQTGSSEGAGFFFFGRISFQAGIFSGGGGGSRGQERVCEIQTG